MTILEQLRRQILAHLQATGTSKIAFAKAHGIARSTFTDFLAQKNNGPTPVNFQKIADAAKQIDEQTGNSQQDLQQEKLEVQAQETVLNS
jgi:hypothetical protein